MESFIIRLTSITYTQMDVFITFRTKHNSVLSKLFEQLAPLKFRVMRGLVIYKAVNCISVVEILKKFEDECITPNLARKSQTKGISSCKMLFIPLAPTLKQLHPFPGGTSFSS